MFSLIRRSFKEAKVVLCEVKCSSPTCKLFLSAVVIVPSLPLCSEAKNQNATIRSRFPLERITPVYRPISVEFQIQQSPTDSPRVGPIGGYNPSPSPKFPESFGALIKLSLSDSVTLLKDYGLGEVVSKKSVQEEARLDNLNKLMSHFGVSFHHP